MSPHRPTHDEVCAAMDSVIQEATAAGRRATVAAVERRLGVSHATFYWAYGDLIRDYFHTRLPAGPTTGSAPVREIGASTPTEVQRRLRSENNDLRNTVSLYEQVIRQLSIDNHELREQLNSLRRPLHLATPADLTLSATR